jgi:hypothetical protein
VKTASLSKGSYLIKVSNTDGWFVGMPLTGTGVGASAVITAIAVDGTVTVDVVSTSTASSSVTGTYNDSTVYWNVVSLSHAFAQGQVV